MDALEGGPHRLYSGLRQARQTRDRLVLDLAVLAVGAPDQVTDGYLSRKTVQSVVEILETPERREQMVNYNYKVAAQHYSYSVLRTRLNAILNYFFGSTVRGLFGKATLPIYEDRDIVPHQNLQRHFDSHSFPRRSV